MLSFSLSFISALSLLAEQAFASPIQFEKLQKRSENGPVIQTNFPDPCIINTAGAWYAFATNTINANGTQINIQVAKSTDFKNWSLVYNANGQQKDALPTLPAWVNPSVPATWAPDVNQVNDGTFVMYYSAATAVDSSKHCVGAATSTNILGPYKPGAAPLFCPLNVGGAIDASGFRDFNGARWVTYKVDGNSLGHGGVCDNTVAPIVPTPIMLQQVAGNGITLIGGNYTILNNAGASDDGVIEAPSMVRTATGEYVLFFSSGCYSSPAYTVNYATSKKITGPFTRYGPLISTGNFGLDAPGGADVHSDASHMVFHAGDNSGETGDRFMYTAVVSISGNKVTI